MSLQNRYIFRLCLFRHSVSLGCKLNKTQSWELFKGV